MLIRRGPKKWSCVFGWDRTTDTFQDGQCVKGYIDATMATLSPCGNWLAYSVTRDRMTQMGYFAPIPYSVVSRAPWLKALAFWDRGGIGLLRENDSRLQLDVHPDQQGSVLPDTTHKDWPATGIHLTERTRPWGYPIARGGLAFEKWQVEGWTPITPWERCSKEESRGVASWRSGVHRIHFEKTVRGTRWKLRLSDWCGSHDDDRTRKDTHRGVNFQTFSLHSSCGEIRVFPDWTSADHDTFRNRIVWTRGQQLWAMELLGDDLGEPRMLLDLTQKEGWRKEAPY